MSTGETKSSTIGSRVEQFKNYAKKKGGELKGKAVSAYDKASASRVTLAVGIAVGSLGLLTAGAGAIGFFAGGHLPSWLGFVSHHGMALMIAGGSAFVAGAVLSTLIGLKRRSDAKQEQERKTVYVAIDENTQIAMPFDIAPPSKDAKEKLHGHFEPKTAQETENVLKTLATDGYTIKRILGNSKPQQPTSVKKEQKPPVGSYKM